MFPRLVSHPSPAPGKFQPPGSGNRCFFAQSRQRSTSHQPGSTEPAISLRVPCDDLKGPLQTQFRTPQKLPPSISGEPRPATQPPTSAWACLFWGAEQGRAPAAGNAPKERPDGRGQLRSRWRPAARAAATTSYAAKGTEGAGSPARDWTAEPRAHGAAEESRQAGPRAASPQCTPGAVVLPSSATCSARLDPYPSQPLGARPLQPRMAACARTHLRIHFAGHDSGFPGALL